MVPRKTWGRGGGGEAEQEIVKKSRSEEMGEGRVTDLHFILVDTDERLRERHGAVGWAKVEETGGGVDFEKEGDVGIVRQRRGEPNYTNHLLRGLDEAQRASDQRLDDRPAVVVEQMHLVDDQQAHGGDQRVRTLSRRHIPLLRPGNRAVGEGSL